MLFSKENIIFFEKHKVMERVSYVSRVNQLDAYLLDQEILKIIHEQLNNAYKELPPGILSKFQPEIDAFLKSLIWLNSIYFNKSTFGQQVLAITYKSDSLTRNRLVLHYLLTIIASYTKEVSHLRFTTQRKLQKVIEWIEFTIKFASIINFFRFLKTGNYPSLLDYILRWNHVSQRGAKMRNIGYAYMNRELIWTGFLELLNVTLPLIDYHSLKKKVKQMILPKSNIQESNRNLQSPVMTVTTTCAICSQRPIIPYHIQCPHIFCYYCLKASTMADPQFSCPICDLAVKDDIHPLIIKTE